MKAVVILLLTVYNLILLGGTAFLVQEYDWSPWWFLFTILVLSSYSSKKEKDE